MRPVSEIFLDLAGVLFDLHAACLALYDRPPQRPWPVGWSIERYLNCTLDDLWLRIDAAGPDFWSQDRGYDYAAAVVSEVEAVAQYWKVPVTVLTSPSERAVSVVGKAQWLAQYFPHLASNCIFTDDKTRRADPTKLLIDDRNKITDPFVAAGGMALVFPQPWNSWQAAYDPEVVDLTRLLFMTREHSRGYVTCGLDTLEWKGPR